MSNMDNTVEETASKLKLSPATVRRLIQDRELTAIRSGKRKWLITDESIAEYRKRQTVSAKPKTNGDGLLARGRTETSPPTAINRKKPGGTSK
jgi:excisionase family DNA binding protein